MKILLFRIMFFLCGPVAGLGTGLVLISVIYVLGLGMNRSQAYAVVIIFTLIGLYASIAAALGFRRTVLNGIQEDLQRRK